PFVSTRYVSLMCPDPNGETSITSPSISNWFANADTCSKLKLRIVLIRTIVFCFKNSPQYAHSKSNIHTFSTNNRLRYFQFRTKSHLKKSPRQFSTCGGLPAIIKQLNQGSRFQCNR